MKNHHTMTGTIIRLSVLALLATLAGCGKSDEPDPCEQAANGIFPVLNGLACLGDIFADGTGDPTGSGTAAFVTPQHTPGLSFSEHEPNTLLGNANPVSMSDSGVVIAGSLSPESDSSDHFVFTPTRAGTYGVYLCGISCNEVLTSSALNLMVLDQSQTTISGTPLGAAMPQALSVNLDTGLAYYVEVSGRLPRPNDEDYQLAVVPNSN